MASLRMIVFFRVIATYSRTATINNQIAFSDTFNPPSSTIERTRGSTARAPGKHDESSVNLLFPFKERSKQSDLSMAPKDSLEILEDQASKLNKKV